MNQMAKYFNAGSKLTTKRVFAVLVNSYATKEFWWAEVLGQRWRVRCMRSAISDSIKILRNVAL